MDSDRPSLLRLLHQATIDDVTPDRQTANQLRFDVALFFGSTGAVKAVQQFGTQRLAVEMASFIKEYPSRSDPASPVGKVTMLY